MIEEFVARMFAIRDASHVAHWAAKGPGSYAQHVALGEFYDSLIDLVDNYVETYQGYYGLIGDVKPVPYSRKDILKQLQAEAKWLSENCEDICKENEALENLLQEIEAHFAKTYYKLRFLS
mgnify:CR=1 FL=1